MVADDQCLNCDFMSLMAFLSPYILYKYSLIRSTFFQYSVLQGEYLILATDYHSFALAWQCMDLPLQHTGEV